MNVIIKSAALSDASLIARAQIDAWQETYIDLLPKDMLQKFDYDERTCLWNQIINQGRDHSESAQLVAKIDGNIVGFGSCGRNRSAECVDAGYDAEISTLYVLKAFHKRRIGFELFQTMARHLLETNLSTASLWVLGSNNLARCFYERVGGVTFQERQEEHPDGPIIEVAYGWSDLTEISTVRQ